GPMSKKVQANEFQVVFKSGDPHIGITEPHLLRALRQAVRIGTPSLCAAMIEIYRVIEIQRMKEVEAPLTLAIVNDEVQISIRPQTGFGIEATNCPSLDQNGI